MKVAIFFVFVFLMTGVLAVEGVIPGSYSVDFGPDMKKSFVFEFILDGKGEPQIGGDLADYAYLDKKIIWDKENIVLTLELPEDLDLVGVHDVRVFVGNIVGFVKVNFGYPENYVDLALAAPNINFGEDVVINLRVSNFGETVSYVEPFVEIYFGENIIANFSGDLRWIESGNNTNYRFEISNFNYSIGEYFVRASSGGYFAEDTFRVGEKNLEILNYTRDIRSDSVEKFEIIVESLWDDKMNEVYAEVRVSGTERGFDSSIVSLSGWEKKTLVGYFNTEGLEGEIPLDIDVYYDGDSIGKRVHILAEKRFNWEFWGGFLVLVLALGYGVYWKFFRN